jgi:hypothetical protein
MKFLKSFTLLLFGALLLIPAASFGQWSFKYQYTVKFVCGTFTRTDGPVAPGTYYTAINVHSSRDSALCRETISIALPGRRSGPVVSLPRGYYVGPGSSIEIDCDDIAKAINRKEYQWPLFHKGFVTIESTSELDVVAVYTFVGSTRQVQSMDIERVTPRLLGR